MIEVKNPNILLTRDGVTLQGVNRWISAQPIYGQGPGNQTIADGCILNCGDVVNIKLVFCKAAYLLEPSDPFSREQILIPSLRTDVRDVQLEDHVVPPWRIGQILESN